MDKKSYIRVARRREFRAVNPPWFELPIMLQGTGYYEAANYEKAGDARLKAKQEVRALRNYEKAFRSLSNPSVGYYGFENDRKRLNLKILELGHRLRESWLGAIYRFY